MTVFVDTSGFYAVFDRDDANHAKAREAWVTLLREPATLLTNNYVLLETTSLLQHRAGMAAVRRFHEDVLPLLQVDWVSEQRPRAGVEAVLTAARKN
jgi:uncharacterized protein